ncbi:MAG: hypothetical protein GX653_03935 [Clostridiales bacterium]|nr:hypothetical protein [Clostridiales bacterium]
MKENPTNEQLRDTMQEGELVKDGFLGDDQRPVDQIVQEDMALLTTAGFTAERLGAAMRALTHKGMAGMGEEVDAGDYLVKAEEYMGLIGCPFKDNHRAAKRNTTATHKATGRTMMWTDLGIHLIQKHGFFQGKGSTYRLEPLELAAFLGLEAE